MSRIGAMAPSAGSGRADDAREPSADDARDPSAFGVALGMAMAPPLVDAPQRVAAGTEATPVTADGAEERTAATQAAGSMPPDAGSSAARSTDGLRAPRASAHSDTMSPVRVDGVTAEPDTRGTHATSTPPAQAPPSAAAGAATPTPVEASVLGTPSPEAPTPSAPGAYDRVAHAGSATAANPSAPPAVEPGAVRVLAASGATAVPIQSVTTDTARPTAGSASQGKPASPSGTLTNAPPAFAGPKSAKGHAHGSGDDARNSAARDDAHGDGAMASEIAAPDASASAAVAALRGPRAGTGAEPATPSAAPRADAPPEARAATTHRPSDQLTVQFQGENGTEGRVRLALRGDALRATIVSSDPATVERLGNDLAGLKRALGERGFTDARVVIQHGADSGRSDDSADARGARRDGREAQHQDAQREAAREQTRRRPPRPQPERQES